jgi:HNH endonuclease
MPYKNYYKCSITGCNGAQRGCGFCYKHYRRFMEHGDPLFTKYAIAETKLKFINDVVLSWETLECLIWPFSHRDGRGYINEEPVSRFVCKLAHGSPPTDKHDAAHNCGNERCVNPHHLRWATRKENMAGRSDTAI